MITSIEFLKRLLELAKEAAESEIVKIVRFDGWQDTASGKREVKKDLRSVTVIKYKIKDTEVFDKAYSVILTSCNCSGIRI